jgi:hypothetical protein
MGALLDQKGIGTQEISEIFLLARLAIPLAYKE